MRWADTTREYDSFDPDDPWGLQVEVYDHTPAERDEALHDMIAAGNHLIRLFNSLPVDADHREELAGRSTVDRSCDPDEPGANSTGSTTP